MFPAKSVIGPSRPRNRPWVREDNREKGTCVTFSRGFQFIFLNYYILSLHVFFCFLSPCFFMCYTHFSDTRHYDFGTKIFLGQEHRWADLQGSRKPYCLILLTLCEARVATSIGTGNGMKKGRSRSRLRLGITIPTGIWDHDPIPIRDWESPSQVGIGTTIPSWSWNPEKFSSKL